MRSTSIAKRYAIWALGSAISLMSISTAEAADVQITAQYVPSSRNPAKAEFSDTTPQSENCAYRCGGTNEFNITTSLEIQDRILDRDSSNPRHWHFASINSDWKDVSVIGPDGANAQVRFRISSFFVQTNGIGRSSQGTAIPGGCEQIFNFGSTDPKGYQQYSWRLPETGSLCSNQPTLPAENAISATKIGIGYRLQTPDPLSLRQGVYHGSVRYSVGEGREFDLGAGSYNDDELVFHFRLTVEHEFKVEQAPGSERVVLQPIGGWSSWTDHGRKPARLQQEAPFHITSSGQFKVGIECEYELYPDSGQCQIKNEGDGHMADLGVDLTMPGMVDVRNNNAPAINLPMNYNNVNGRRRFGSNGHYVEKRPSRLLFSVSGRSLEDMLTRPGSTYRGNVTLIFDADAL